MKKGQTEAIGLVVIVILIALGLLFFFIFSFKDEPTKKTFIRKGLAVSAMTSLLKTTIPGNICGLYNNEELSIGEVLLEDCAQSKLIGFSRYTCDQQPSCTFVQSYIAQQLSVTLGTWKKRYSFQTHRIILGTGEVENLFPPVELNGGCSPTRERDSSGLFPLQTDAGLVNSILYVCD